MKYLCITLFMAVALNAGPATVEQLFNVQTVTVKKESVALTQKNYGYVVADEARQCSVTPRFGGYVVDLFADTTYRQVKKGDPLLRVYSPELLQAKEEYLNTYRYIQKRPDTTMLASAKAKLVLLGLDESRISEIVKTGRADAYSTIKSPCTGFIFKKNIYKGSAFSASQALFTVTDLRRLWVEAKIYQKEMPGLNRFTDFTVFSEATGKTYKAKKLMLYPELDTKEATATLRLSVDNQELSLYPGMYITLTASVKTSEYLTLPRSAVIRRNGSWYVFMMGEYEGEYEPLEVELKAIEGDRYAISSGVSEGDEVVGNALFMMDADARINGLY